MLPFSNWPELARHVSLGTAPNMQILRERGRDVRIARVIPPDGKASVVVKLWNRQGWRDRLRRLARATAAQREWRTLQRLYAYGVAAPQPLAHIAHIPRPAAHTEGLIMNDLGVCSDATEHLKHLIRQGLTDQEDAFYGNLIAVTEAMIHLGLLDIDHRLPNFVVTPSGVPVRLDFELNIRRPWPRLWTRPYGLMLGTFLGSYVFAVQPDILRVRRMADRLRQRLRPPARALRIAAARVTDMLQRQRRESGITVHIEDLWGEKHVKH